MTRAKPDISPNEDIVISFLENRGFSLNHIKNIIGKKKQVKEYTSDELCEALLLRSLSAKAYTRLRDMTYMPLPHHDTLSKKIRHFRCEPGLQTDLFYFLKLKLATMENWQRQSVLLFDEMQISEGLDYCRRLDQSFRASKKVQVVLLKGIIASWKHICYYDFGTMMTKNLLLSIISKCEQNNSVVRAIAVY